MNERIRNNWIWIAVTGLVLYANENARNISENLFSGCYSRAQRLYRALDGFARALCGLTVIFLIAGLILLLASIFPETQTAQIVRIIAIWLLVAWIVVLYITLRLTAGVVETAISPTSASQQETIKKALRIPHHAGAIVLTLLIAWALQVYVWPAMPAFIGSFVVLVILIWTITGIIKNQPPSPNAARTWTIIACIIFGLQIAAFYLAHGDDLISRKFQNWREAHANAAQNERYTHGTHGLVKTFSLQSYKRLHNGDEPIVMEFVGDSMEFIDDYGKLDNREFGLFEGNPPEKIHNYVQKRFGRLKVVVFESLPSLRDPVIRRYIAPVDCFTTPSSQAKTQLTERRTSRPPYYIAGLQRTGMQTEADVILAGNHGYRFDEIIQKGDIVQVDSSNPELIWLVTDESGRVVVEGPFPVNASHEVTSKRAFWCVARTRRGSVSMDTTLGLIIK